MKIGDMLQGTVSETEETITRAALNGSAAKLLPAGTVLISIFATIGRTATLGVDAATNQAIAGLTPRSPSILTPTYLRRYLDSVVSTLEQRARGVAQVNINAGILRALPIPLPPLTEQQLIAAILDKADCLRAKRRAALAQLDTLTHSIFLDMFGDPASNHRWAMATLEEIADVQGGLQLTASRSSLHLDAPYLRVANVHRGFLDLSEIKRMRVTAAELARARLIADDLLVVEGHGNPKEIGRVARWDGSIAECVHQNHLIRVRLDPAKSHASYVCDYLNSVGGRRHLLRSGKTTSGLNTINVSNVRATPIALPPFAIQQTYGRRLEAVDRVRRRQLDALADLDTLFAALQHRAFRGEL